MLNKVMLIGNLGADPEVRYMPSGDTVTNIRLATNRRWRDKQTGEQKTQTEWHRVTFFNIGNFKLAEIAGEYLKKGSKCYVEGRIQTRKWQDNTGQDRYSTEIIADQMQMLDSRTGGTDDFNQQGSYTAPQTNQNQQQPVQQFNQAPAQQPAQQFTPPPPPVQQPFNQGQQTPPLQQPTPPVQPPVNQGQAPQQQFNQQPPVPPPVPQNPASAPVSDDFDDDVPF